MGATLRIYAAGEGKPVPEPTRLGTLVKRNNGSTAVLADPGTPSPWFVPNALGNRWCSWGDLGVTSPDQILPHGVEMQL